MKHQPAKQRIMNKDQFFEALEKEDFKYKDWLYNLLQNLEDLYARGYITRHIEDFISFEDNSRLYNEQLRAKLLTLKNWDIWE